MLRFGEYTRTADPGLQLQAARAHRAGDEGAGAAPAQAGVRLPDRSRPGCARRYSDRDFEGESLMLTGDLNVAVVEWIAQYRVDDPYKYLFKVRNVTETFRDMNEAVMRAVVGDRSVNEVLTVGRQEIDDRGRAQAAGAVRPVRDRASWSSRSCSRTSTRRTRSSPPSTRSTRPSRSARRSSTRPAPSTTG